MSNVPIDIGLTREEIRKALEENKANSEMIDSINNCNGPKSSEDKRQETLDKFLDLFFTINIQIHPTAKAMGFL
jgi:hypothetical protein